MMKHQTPDTMKFKKFARRLSLREYEAAGLLELLWIATQKNAPRGDIGRYDNEEIAIALDWPGDQNELVQAFVETGWLDECPVHRLVVHDWEDHAPRFVHALAKRLGGFAKPMIDSASLQSATTVPDCSASLKGTTVADYSMPTPNLTKPNLTKPLFCPSDDEPVKPDPLEAGTNPNDVVSEWNARAKQSPTLKEVRSLTDGRRKKLVTRLSDPSWPWREAIAKLPLPNRRGSGWQPSFDWLIENATNAVKVVEGVYDWLGESDERQRSQPREPAPLPRLDPIREAV